MKKLSKHISHYLPLLGILGAGWIAFFSFSYDQDFQVYILLSLGAAYVAWGIVHHTLHKDLSVEIIVEYISVAVLVIAVLLSVIVRS